MLLGGDYTVDLLQLLRETGIERGRALRDSGVMCQRVQFFVRKLGGFFALERQSGDLHRQRLMHATRDRFVLHFALQADQHTFKFGAAICVNREFAPRLLRVHQLGQRHLVRL